MRVGAEQAREWFAGARVARLATADADGRPHVVPVTFALLGDVVVFAVDHKPKTTARLRRLANIESNSQVSVLVDEYHDDWRQLRWARADGTASILRGDDGRGTRAAALRELCDKYPQYAARPPEGALVRIAVNRWSGWSAACDGPTR
ncbi:MAG: TIGR03668 family PPOX class F420-dependent oxidoreductase [Haloechinothrix sp.]